MYLFLKQQSFILTMSWKRIRNPEHHHWLWRLKYILIYLRSYWRFYEKWRNTLHCIQTAADSLVSSVYFPNWNWSRNLSLILRLTVRFVKRRHLQGFTLVVLRKLPVKTDCALKPTQEKASSLTHFGEKINYFNSGI